MSNEELSFEQAQPVDAEVISETKAAPQQPKQTQALAVRKEPEPQPLEQPATVTAAQAKVNAVADLTMAAYQRASTLELTKDESDQLLADFEMSDFRTGAAGKEELIYLEHQALRMRLNRVLGLGKWAIIQRNRWVETYQHYDKQARQYKTAHRVYVEAMLLIRGCYVGEAVGDMTYWPDNAQTNYGDAVEGAQSEALRRCCKNFGIGLQPWSKAFQQKWHDWKKSQAAAPRAPVKREEPPAPAQTAAKPAQPAQRPAPAAPKKGPAPTEEDRAKFLNMTKAGMHLAQEFFVAVEAILETEQLSDVPPAFIPVGDEQRQALMLALDAFAGGEPARLPYPKNEGSVAPGPAPAAPAVKPPAAKPATVNTGSARVMKSDPAAQPWYNILVPVPRKGMKRVEYLNNPDTIGSLYEARHEDEELRRRLFGFVNKYEAAGWTGTNGRYNPPSQDDIAFRAGLDQFADWFKEFHKDEEL